MKILLIGNYAADRQQSMLRYAAVLSEGLRDAGHDVRLYAPRARLNPGERPAQSLWKWLGYADKFVLARADIAALERWADVVHVCDHSNAPYVPKRPLRPWVVTCHDLLAVRGALGEDTDCPASRTGRVLQRWILSGLRRADRLVAVSAATLADVRRLVDTTASRSRVVPPPLNYPYRRLDDATLRVRLAAIPGLRTPYVLLVGSDQRRKNRAAAVETLGRIRDRWPGIFVFAGEPLGNDLRARAAALGVGERMLDVPSPSGETLEALYNGALALLFPSRFEGFGWPPLEAQACGCPVVCSDAPPMPEVTGGAARICSLERESEFADALLELAADRVERDRWIALGEANVRRYDVPSFTAGMLATYAGALDGPSVAAAPHPDRPGLYGVPVSTRSHRSTSASAEKRDA